MFARAIKSIVSSDAVFYMAAFLVIALILFAKNPYLYLWPPLQFDDSFLLQHHVNDPDNWIFFHSGYFSLLPNVIAKLALAVFPLQWIPRIFAIACLFICSLTLWWFCLNWHASLVSNRNARLAIVALIAIQPIGNWTVQNVLMIQMWNVAIISVLLLAVEQSIDTLKWLLMTPVILIFIWSNPVSVCFLPIFVLGCIRTLRQHDIARFSSYLILCIAVVLYFYTGIISYKDIPTLRQVYNIMTAACVSGLERVLLDSFFPCTLRMMLREGHRLIPITIAVAVFISLGCLVWKATAANRPMRRLSLLTGYVCLTFTMFAFLRMKPSMAWVCLERQYRYFYAQQYCLLLLFLISAYLLIKNMKQHVKILVLLSAFILVSASAIIENHRYHYMYYSDNITLVSLYDAGQKVAACFKRAQESAVIREGLMCEDIQLQLEREKD